MNTLIEYLTVPNILLFSVLFPLVLGGVLNLYSYIKDKVSPENTTKVKQRNSFRDRRAAKVFLKVINNGYYQYEELMCQALKVAYHHGKLSDKEFKDAVLSIDNYLKDTGFVSLRRALSDSGFTNSKEDRVAIYKDWLKRPPLRYNPNIYNSFREFLYDD